MSSPMSKDRGCPRLDALMCAFTDADAPPTEEALDDLMHHAAQCSVCRRWLDSLDSAGDDSRASDAQGVHTAGASLARETARLPREIAPQRDLWPDIEGRLTPRAVPRSAPLRAWLAAAALLAIGLAAGYLFRGFGAETAPSGPVPASGSLTALEARSAGTSLDEGAGGVGLAAYRDATRDLRDMVEARAADLDPAIRQELEAHVAIIETAIRELEAALVDTPESPKLEHLLLARYRQQIALLTRFAPSAG